MITTTCVDKIHRVDLKAVISEYVELHKRGMNYVGLCPFHSEHTPSFSVNPGKGIYKCFGCGEGGNSPVQFLMDLKGLTYPEALEEVARKGRIVIEYDQNASTPEQKQKAAELRDKSARMRVVLDGVMQAYQINTFKGVADIDAANCEGRIYSLDTIKKWGLAYAPDENWITKIHEAQSWGLQDLVDLGVLKSSDRGGHYDFYRGRLLFPIEDHQGRVVGIAGRKPKQNHDVKSPKYINAPESLLYKKDEVLYGLHKNKRAIHKAGCADLVEGYTDVITMDVFGFSTAVATCGTALTPGQVSLLKRYVDQVRILRDGDDAGRAAAARDVEILIRAGIMAKICILPPDHDPDSFLWQHQAAGFQFYINENTEDALIWLVMSLWDDKDVFKRENAIQKAADMIACLESPSLVEHYIRELTDKKRMGSIKKALNDQIKIYREKQLKKTGSGLTPDQEEDVVEFGMYDENNRYFLSSSSGGASVQISNFVVRPLMLIIGNAGSQRLVEIVNEYNRSFIINVESEAFTGLTEFKKVVERFGNFRFIGKPEHFEKVKAKVYRDMQDCFPVTTMGWHKQGFYAWGNGISVDGIFTPINEYGIVQHGDTKFFLPAFSRINDHVQGDEDDGYEFERKFAFYPGDCINFTDWTRLMVEVHGYHGAAGVCYIIASLFRDIIFNKLSFFPHLNLFGPTGAGKSFMARSLMAVFGREIDHDPFNLASGTPVAFKRRLAQASNAITWFDEYSNNIDFRRVEALKGAYDGAGHERGVTDNSSNRTKTTKVKSAIVMSGQQQPTQDVALFKRVISLNFNSASNTLEKQVKAKRLKDIEKTGQLTNITQFILQHRELVQEKFSQAFDELVIETFAKIAEKDAILVEDRIVKNHVVLIAIYYIFKQVLPFGFEGGLYANHIVDNIISQSDAIMSEDEVSIFWRIVEYLLAAKMISHWEDIIIEERAHETFQNELDRKDKRDSIQKNFPAKKCLVYIRFAKIYSLYQEKHRAQRNKVGLDIGALQYYLRQTPAYVGQKRAKKFGEKAYSCYVFDLDDLPVELPISFKEGGGGESPFD